MAISIRPSGEAGAVAQAGQVIGQAQRAEEERKAGREAQAREIAYAWEAQKMLLNSQQEFAHEQRLVQSQLDRDARAQEWEVEKMEMRSRMDFEQEEKERIRKVGALQNSLSAIDKAVDDGRYRADDDRILSLRTKYEMDLEAAKMGMVSGAPLLAPEREEESSLLTPDEQQQAALIKAGIEPRATQPQEAFGRPPWWASPEWKDTPEGKAAAKQQATQTYVQQLAEYLAVEKLTALGGIVPQLQPTPTETTAPMYQQNKKTGQRRVSFDGGKSWQIL